MQHKELECERRTQHHQGQPLRVHRLPRGDHGQHRLEPPRDDRGRHWPEHRDPHRGEHDDGGGGSIRGPRQHLGATNNGMGGGGEIGVAGGERASSIASSSPSHHGSHGYPVGSGGGDPPRAALRHRARDQDERVEARDGGRCPADQQGVSRGHRGAGRHGQRQVHGRDDGRHLRARVVQPPAFWAAPPSWMYLPSQGIGTGEGLVFADVPSRHPASVGGEDASLAAGTIGIRGRGEAPGPRIASQPPTTIGTGEGLVFADVPSRHPASVGGEDASLAAGTIGIRGRGEAPGPRIASQPPTTSFRSGAACAGEAEAAAAPRTLDTSALQGGRALDARRKAEARLTASHAGIETSLANHAERVARKTARGQDSEAPSAADRMAALRRRLSDRIAAAVDTANVAGGAAAPAPAGYVQRCRGHGQGGSSLDNSGVGLAASASPPSNEDVKMHSVASVGSMDGGTAAGVGGSGPNHAANHAAAAWAWHGRVPGGAGGGVGHLSAG